MTFRAAEIALVIFMYIVRDSLAAEPFPFVSVWSAVGDVNATSRYPATAVSTSDVIWLLIAKVPQVPLNSPLAGRISFNEEVYEDIF
jgi:hypothetical protein